MRRVTLENLEEQLYRERLAGGLSLYLWPKPGFRRKHVLLAVEYGSLDRSFGSGGHREPVHTPAGVAHFLEHRLFSRADGDLGERFAARGAEVNAYTTFTTTVFLLSCVDDFASNVELLLDYVLRPEFTRDGVDREREIITREIQLYSDHLEWVSFFNALRSLYPGHPLGTDMAGTLESVGQIDCAVLELCHRTFYQSGNIGLFISGDLDPVGTRDRVAAALERCGAPSGAPFRRYRAPAAPTAGGELRELRLPIAQPRLWLAFRDRRAGLRGPTLLRRELALELALDTLFGSSSRFYNRQYENGLIDDDSFGFEVYAEPDFGFCLLGGDAPRPDALEQAMANVLRRARRSRVLELDFPLFRRKAYGHLIYRFDQVDSCAALMHSAVSRGGQPFDLVAAHEHVRPEDLRDSLETCLDPENYGVCRVLPLAGRRRTAGGGGTRAV